MREVGIGKVAFTSTSTVYGEPSVIPVPEDYSPLKPISLYGATKLASEALIIGYSGFYGIEYWIFRLANIVGGRFRRGVVFDFVRKLNKDPKRLEILGDGTQRKSYLHVSECVDAILYTVRHSKGGVFNVGSEDDISVRRIAEITVEEMGLDDVEFVYNSPYDGRGWKGDVKYIRLDISKLKGIGWRPRMNSEESIRVAVKDLLV